MASNELYYPLPQPHELSMREKEDGMGAYLMMFAAFAVSLPLPIINLIAAIAYYYTNRKKSRFVHFHCLQSLLSQLPTTLLNWGVLYVLIRTFFVRHEELNQFMWSYIIFAIVANLIYTVFSLIAAVRARQGRMMYFLFFGSYSYARVYRSSNRLVYANETAPEHSPFENKPPL